MRSEEGYEEAAGTSVVAAGSGSAFAAAVRSSDFDQFPSWTAFSASAIVWAWLAVGVRCGATTTLRCRLVWRPSARLWARYRCTASVEVEALVMSPWNTVDSGASATIAVVPPPMGRAAEGVYDRSPVSRKVSLRAITLSAPAEVATLTMEGSTAPLTGQAKSVVGFTWRIGSTVLTTTSVASLR
ncbi:hypothetical protein SHIRM173S_00609 [Streptomyces hirsutus]